MSINNYLHNFTAAVTDYLRAFFDKLLTVTEAPGNADKFYACVTGGLHVHLTVTDINALLRRNAQHFRRLINIYGHRLTLSFNAYAYCTVNKAGEIIEAKLIYRLMKLI